MVSFRQQMQELVEKIASSRSERQHAVAQYPKMREQLRKQVLRQRTETRRELNQQSSSLTRELQQFNASNKRAVGRMLSSTRALRLNSAKSLRNRLQRDTARNRSEIARAMQQNQNERKRMVRNQLRMNQHTHQSISNRVASLRAATRRATRSLNQDRMEARKIWATLRNSPSGHYVVQRPADAVLNVSSVPARPPMIAVSNSFTASAPSGQLA